MGLDCEVVGGLGGIGLGCDDGGGCGFSTKVGGFRVWLSSEEVVDVNWVELGVMKVSNMVKSGFAQEENFVVAVEGVSGQGDDVGEG